MKQLDEATGEPLELGVLEKPGEELASIRGFEIGTILEAERGNDTSSPLYNLPTGLYTVLQETNGGEVYGVPSIWTLFGIHTQVGGIYPRGSRVLMGKVSPMDTYVILGALPNHYKSHVDLGAAIPIEEGEFILQGLRIDGENLRPGLAIRTRREGYIEIGGKVKDVPVSIKIGELKNNTDTEDRITLTVGSSQIKINSNGDIKLTAGGTFKLTTPSQEWRTIGDKSESVENNYSLLVQKNLTLLHESGAMIQLAEDGSLYIIDGTRSSMISLTPSDGGVTIRNKSGAYIYLKGDIITMVARDSIVAKANDYTFSGSSVALDSDKVALGKNPGITKGVARKGDCTQHWCPIIGTVVKGQINNDGITMLPGGATSQSVVAAD